MYDGVAPSDAEPEVRSQVSRHGDGSMSDTCAISINLAAIADGLR
jgi:hypothetical protein